MGRDRRYRPDGSLEFMGEHDWQSPFHYKVRSPSIFGGHITRPLSDRKVHYYALHGYYGAEELEKAREREKRRR